MLPQQDNISVELEIGGVFRIQESVDYPEWAKYFDRSTRCDRCWEQAGSFTSEVGSDRWVCRTCRFRRLNDADNETSRILWRKINAHVRRLWWNYTHKEKFKLPNETGYR